MLNQFILFVLHRIIPYYLRSILFLTDQLNVRLSFHFAHEVVPEEFLVSVFVSQCLVPRNSARLIILDLIVVTMSGRDYDISRVVVSSVPR